MDDHKNQTPADLIDEALRRIEKIGLSDLRDDHQMWLQEAAFLLGEAAVSARQVQERAGAWQEAGVGVVIASQNVRDANTFNNLAHALVELNERTFDLKTYIDGFDSESDTIPIEREFGGRT